MKTNTLPFKRHSVSKSCRCPYCLDQLQIETCFYNTKSNTAYDIYACDDENAISISSRASGNEVIWDTHLDQLTPRLRKYSHHNKLTYNIIISTTSELHKVAQEKEHYLALKCIFTISLNQNLQIPDITSLEMPFFYYLSHRSDLKLQDCFPYNLKTSPFTFNFNLLNSDYRHLLRPSSVIFSSNQEQQRVSVVIPSYQHSQCLKHVLKQLAKSHHQKFEVIIVTLSSEVHTIELAKKYLAKSLPGKVITLDFKRDSLGDLYYCAGHLRNIGASYAESDKILFLDSDVLLPKDALIKIDNDLNSSDVVLPVRKNKRPFIKRIFTRPPLRNSDPFWQNFYASTKNWHEETAPWRFVSTYALGVKKNFLFQAGGFDSSFCTYGLEDTELGYRLHHLGAKFKKIQTTVEHIDHHNNRSEYANDEKRRQKLLSNNTSLFYRCHLQKDILEAHEFYLRGTE